MPARLLITLIALVLIAMGAVFTLAVLPHQHTTAHEKYIRLNDIRGMAVVYRGLEYTLNFEQQNETALLLNSSKPAAATVAMQEGIEKAPFDKILIYPFNQAPTEITPLGFFQDRLFFATPAWNEGAPLVDTSQGILKQLLLTTYGT